MKPMQTPQNNDHEQQAGGGSAEAGLLCGANCNATLQRQPGAERLAGGSAEPQRFEAPGVTLILGECLDVLPALAVVDAVITDPPYSITSEASSSVSRASRNVRETQFFEAWLREQVGALVKACKPSAGLWMSLDWRGAMVLDVVCAKLNLREPKIGVWDKEVIGMGGVLRNSYECFAVVVLDGWEKLTSSERDVWEHRWTQGGRASDHPAEKPVALMERACRLLCRQGATVLDPYMGSGTTGIACIRTGRRFIGIERDPEHFATAVKRIRDELAQGSLNLTSDGAERAGSHASDDSTVPPHNAIAQRPADEN